MKIFNFFLLIVVATATIFQAAESKAMKQREPYQIAEQGRQLVQTIRSEGGLQKIGRGGKRDSRQLIQDLVYYLYYIARKEGHIFKSGTFVIYDPSGKLYEFLTSFYLKGEAKTSGRAYKRDSSHFNSFKREGRDWLSQMGKKHFGFDVDLPAFKKKTILFNRISEDGTIFYLKPEAHGTKGKNIVAHSGDFVRHISKKKITGLRGSDNNDTSVDLNDSREDAPKQIVNQYLELIKETPDNILDKDNKATFAQRAKVWGIQAMYEDSKILVENKKIESFRATLDKIKALQRENPRLSHLDKRFGFEVIITDKELEEYNKPITKADWDAATKPKG